MAFVRLLTNMLFPFKVELSQLTELSRDNPKYMIKKTVLEQCLLKTVMNNMQKYCTI